MPVWPFAYQGFATVYTGTSIADAYNNPKVAYEAEKKTCRDFGWVFTPMIGYAAFGGWEFGGEGVIPLGGEPTSANQVISPKQFEQFALPYLKETHERVLAMGFKTFLMHICGEQNLNLPYWAQIPMGDPGIVSFGQLEPKGS